MARAITSDPVPLAGYLVTVPAEGGTPPTGSSGGADVLAYPVLAESPAPAVGDQPPAEAAADDAASAPPSDVEVFRVAADDADAPASAPPPEAVPAGGSSGGYAQVLDTSDALPAGTAPSAQDLAQALPLDGQTIDGFFLQHRLSPAAQQAVDRQPTTEGYGDVLGGGDCSSRLRIPASCRRPTPARRSPPPRRTGARRLPLPTPGPMRRCSPVRRRRCTPVPG
jgi:hypothetical protein